VSIGCHVSVKHAAAESGQPLVWIAIGSSISGFGLFGMG